MKNHFIFCYLGNKRNESQHFLKHVNLDNVSNIIEPFCGSSAISFAIWLEHKDKFNYYLNDSDKKLIEVYNVLKNETIEYIEEKINIIANSIHNKEEWLQALKQDHDIYNYIFFKKYSALGRYGFYPIDFDKRVKTFKITKETQQFIEFLKQPYVYITNNDWFVVFDNFKNDEKALFMIDPPYVMACNDFYTDKKLNMYQYFYDNKIESFKSKIYLVLEDHWILRLLFMNNNILSKYEKKYEISKKQTNHIIIYNH
jgi:site-specific DNA-adenine methylase